MRKVIRGYAKDKNLKTRVELRCTLMGMCRLRSLARPAAKKDFDRLCDPGHFPNTRGFCCDQI